MKDQYEPYGDQWEKEMMRLTKNDLIKFLRQVCITLKRYREYENKIK